MFGLYPKPTHTIDVAPGFKPPPKTKITYNQNFGASQSENIDEELAHLDSAFRTNGYSAEKMHRAMYSRRRYTPVEEKVTLVTSTG